MERETLKSRLGFILLSAGCAIGIGNVWKFPYMAGQGGGGAFVLFYLLFLVILGLPIMTMEFAVGRASRKSPVRAYQVLEKTGQKWHIHGYFTLIGCYLLMMFYTTVAGWMLHYFYMTAAGKLSGLNADAGTTILMVTHDCNAASYCKRILFIQDGVLFHELRRDVPDETQQAFYGRILSVMAQLGGGSANVL